MVNTQPILIALAIIAGVTVLGFIISYVRSSSHLRGYEELAADVAAIAKALKAQTFRDGDDLVVSGNYGKLPAIVRFSYADNTPGLNVRMKAPANFTLSVVPKGAKTAEGRLLVRTTDEMFDARFVARTDHPTQARLFVGGKQALAQLQKLCCSSKTFLTVTTGSLELSELVIPNPYTARHINDHLESMSKVAAALAQMPGADAVKITPYKEEKSKLVRAAIAVLAVTGVLVVMAAVYERPGGFHLRSIAAQLPDGILPSDAQHINGLMGWRVANPEDFDPDALGWLRGQHTGNITGRISGAFSGTDKPKGAVYIMIAESGPRVGTRRIVLLVNNQVQLDAAYPNIAIAAAVPKENFSAIEWQAMVPPPPDGAGLLVVRNWNDPKSGVIFYMSNGRLMSAPLANFQQVNVE